MLDGTVICMTTNLTLPAMKPVTVKNRNSTRPGQVSTGSIGQVFDQADRAYYNGRSPSRINKIFSVNDRSFIRQNPN
jgi:hypothetical protein